MNIDNMTIAFTVWGVATVGLMLAFAYCKGCCIKKLFGKSCTK